MGAEEVMNLVASLVPVGFSIGNAIANAIQKIQASRELDEKQKAIYIAQLRASVRAAVDEVKAVPIYDPSEHIKPDQL